MKRRKLLQTSIAASAGAAMAGSAENRPEEIQIVDTNISLFRWPFRRLPLDETKVLVKKCRDLGIVKAFAGSFEGIFHRDISTVNRRLAQECGKHPELLPVGSINLALSGWERDLKLCVEKHVMCGIRLHPNYHGYKLDDPRFTRLLKLAGNYGIFVQIMAVFEDVRTQPDLLRSADTDLKPLLENHATKIQILNYRPRRGFVEKLAEISTISFDIARIDQTDGIATLLESIPTERVLFGTHAPFLIPEASLIRVHESGLPENILRKILQSNAEKMMLS